MQTERIRTKLKVLYTLDSSATLRGDKIYGRGNNLARVRIIFAVRISQSFTTSSI